MKILCLGNNSAQTDKLTENLALEHQSINQGLITDINKSFCKGFYHTSVYDILPENIIILAKKFDRVILLDQSIETWDHPTAYYNTINLKKHIENFEFQNVNSDSGIEYWENLVKQNKSFCIFPFIELLTQNGHTTVCCRSNKPVTDIESIIDFNTDKNYEKIRKSLLKGEKISHCTQCYRDEENGILSARQQETVEWANFLNLNSINDLTNLNGPYYYEIRPSNTCNLQCRICGPNSSHLIEKEYNILGLHDTSKKYTYHNFDIVDISKVKKLYIAGGEPTAMPELYQFLKKCIDNNQTDFEILINTNAQKVNNKLLDLGKHFKNLNYIVSIDGYNKANEYSRWPSQWNQTVDNIKKLINNGHQVTFNITLSLYTIFSFKDLVFFLQENFSNNLIHSQFAYNFYPFVFEFDKDLINDLELIKNTAMYQGNNLFQSFVDTVIKNSQESKLNQKKLNDFFKFNNLLDKSRNIQLKDYIPELEKLRPIDISLSDKVCNNCGRPSHCSGPLYDHASIIRTFSSGVTKICEHCNCSECKN